MVHTYVAGPNVNIVLELDMTVPAQDVAGGHIKALTQIMQRPCVTDQQYHVRHLALTALTRAGTQAQNHAKISLSHTHGASSVAWTDTNNIHAIGIDVEAKTRVLPPRTAKFFISPRDDTETIGMLPLWCLKEAALKCMDQFQGILRLKDIHIQRSNLDYFTASTATQSCTCQLIASQSSYWLAVAWQFHKVR